MLSAIHPVSLTSGSEDNLENQSIYSQRVADEIFTLLSIDRDELFWPFA